MPDCKNNVIEFKKKKLDPVNDISVINKEALIAEINKLPDGEMKNFAIICSIDGVLHRAHRAESYFELMGEIEDFKIDMYVWQNDK